MAETFLSLNTRASSGSYNGDDDSSTNTDRSEMRRSVGILHFAFISAMKQFFLGTSRRSVGILHFAFIRHCTTEGRLYEFFLAFDQVFVDTYVVFGSLKDVHKAKAKAGKANGKGKHKGKRRNSATGRVHERVRQTRSCRTTRTSSYCCTTSGSWGSCRQRTSWSGCRISSASTRRST